MPSLFIKRGTRSQLNTAASSSGLNAGELYLITDENRFAVGLTSSTYETFAKESEAGGSGGIELLEKSTSDVQIVNTTTETNIVSYEIAGGTLGTSNMVRLTAAGFLINTTGGTSGINVRLRIKYGSTTLYDDQRNSWGNSSNGGGFRMELILGGNGSTSAQQLTGQFLIGATGSQTTGFGDIGSDEIYSNGILGGDSTEDSTGAKDFEVSIQLTTASADFSFTKYHHILESIS